MKRKFPGTIIRIVSFLLIAVLAVVVSIPFLWMISTSLKPNLQAVFQFPPQLIPHPPAWSNYLKAWNSAPFNRYLMNSVIVSVSSVAFEVINACLAAYVFSKIRFPGRDFLFLLFLAVMMVPSQVTVVPNYIILSKLGWIDTYWALIVPFVASAYGTFMIRQAFLDVPDDLVDAARVDGASHFTILRYVMIPLSRPMVLTFALLNFNWRWNDYFWTLIMTNSDTMRTLPVGVIAMQAGAEGGTNWHYMMAAAVMVILPVLILFAVTQRYFVEGISHSGLKGI
jgi:ABC-type glycerol-3-phosphate transport system permease component